MVWSEGVIQYIHSGLRHHLRKLTSRMWVNLPYNQRNREETHSASRPASICCINFRCCSQAFSPTSFCCSKCVNASLISMILALFEEYISGVTIAEDGIQFASCRERLESPVPRGSLFAIEERKQIVLNRTRDADMKSTSFRRGERGGRWQARIEAS